MTSTTSEERGRCVVCLEPDCTSDNCEWQSSPRPRGSAPLRPTDTQLTYSAVVLDRFPVSEGSEGQEAIAAAAAWLHDLGSGRAMARSLESRGEAPGECVTPSTASVAVAEVYDSGNAQKAASIAAKAAARDAMARGADPLIVVDHALREIIRFREKTGLSAQYVAQDPLAALVVELRHKRVPPPFARVVGAMARASYEEAQMVNGYSDGHERRRGDWSLLLLLDLAELAAMEGTREEIAEKAIGVADFFAGMLPGWQETICDAREGGDLADPTIHAEIDSAADAFIAWLVKAAR